MSGGMRLRQVQRQQFSLQMRQGLRLLQLTGDDLAAEISAEVSANPLLDRASSRESFAGGLPRAAVESSAAAQTLTDHLLAQLALAPLDRAGRALAHALIEELEPDGYLRADLGRLTARLGVTPAAMAAALATLQGFEPAGVFARDLAECLALQLAERDRLDPLMRGLLARLELVADGRLRQLQAELGCDREDLDDMLAELRGLSPAPGLAFERDLPPAVLPEVRVVPAPGGGWAVESWAPHLPRLIVREGQFERLAARCRREDEVAYLRERLSAARRFAEMMERRGRTVLDVAAEIVKRQEGFLEKGPTALKPLAMQTVADALGVHQSTVSRTVADKTMLTPRGTLPFKAFFAAAARTWDASDLTRAQLVGRIGALIAGEVASGRILSDEAIVEELGAVGIDIARRTVAKHREALGLPTAARRRDRANS